MRAEHLKDTEVGRKFRKVRENTNSIILKKFLEMEAH
jgi:hypothetical protein